VLACALTIPACSDEEQDTLATRVIESASPICKLAEAAASALVDWRGGALPQGLDNVCEGLLQRWATGELLDEVHLEPISGDSFDIVLPPVAPAPSAVTISPDVQAALVRLQASLDAAATSGS